MKESIMGASIAMGSVLMIEGDILEGSLYGIVVPNPNPKDPRNLAYVQWSSNHLAYTHPFAYFVDDLIEMATNPECQWFFGCHHLAVALREHSTLTSVPVCADHIEKETQMAKDKSIDLSKVREDDKGLDKAGRREKSGDPTLDTLVDAADDLDGE